MLYNIQILSLQSLLFLCKNDIINMDIIKKASDKNGNEKARI